MEYLQWLWCIKIVMKGKEFNNVAKIHMYVFLSFFPRSKKFWIQELYDTHINSNTKIVQIYIHIFLSRTKVIWFLFYLIIT